MSIFTPYPSLSPGMARATVRSEPAIPGHRIPCSETSTTQPRPRSPEEIMTEPGSQGIDYHGTMLLTEQMDACRAFYRSLLAVAEEVGSGWARFQLGDGTMLALHAPWQEGMTVQGGSQVLLLQVQSLAAHATRLAALGIDASSGHEIPGGAVVTIHDPDGRMVQLIEYAPSEQGG